MGNDNVGKNSHSSTYMNIPSVTIGIPAYNEQSAISRLLNDIKRQRTTHYALKEVLIYSDGSTDTTVSNVQKVRGLPITIIESRKRQGKAAAANAIFQKAKGDIVVLFDADVSLIDPDTISKLIRDIALGKADLSGAHVSELPVRNIFQRLLKSSMEYKGTIFSVLHGGNNVYTCHGRGRAFSKRLFRSMRFIHSTNEDAYSYLYCIKHKFRYTYVSDATVWYTLPENVRDHEYQSVRFFQSRHTSDQEFGREFVDSAYKIPLHLTVSTLFRHILKDPIILLYIALSTYLSVKSRFMKREGDTWNVAVSSKKISKEARV